MCIALILILNSFFAFYNLIVEYCEHVTAAILIVLIVSAITVPTFILLKPMELETKLDVDEDMRKYLAIGLIVGAIVMGVMLLVLFLKTWRRCTRSNDQQITVTPQANVRQKLVTRKWHQPDRSHLFGESQSWDNNYDSSIDTPSEIRDVIDETRSTDNRKSIEALAAASKKIVSKLKAVQEQSKSTDSQSSVKSERVPSARTTADGKGTLTSSITVIGGGNVKLNEQRTTEEKLPAKAGLVHPKRKPAVQRQPAVQRSKRQLKTKEVQHEKPLIIDRIPYGGKLRQKLLGSGIENSSYGSLDAVSTEDEHVSLGRITNLMKFNAPLIYNTNRNRSINSAVHLPEPQLAPTYNWNCDSYASRSATSANQSYWIPPDNNPQTLYATNPVQPVLTLLSPVAVLTTPEGYFMPSDFPSAYQPQTSMTHQGQLSLPVSPVMKCALEKRKKSYIDSVIFSESFESSKQFPQNRQEHSTSTRLKRERQRGYCIHDPVRRLKSDPPTMSCPYYGERQRRRSDYTSLRAIEPRHRSTYHEIRHSGSVGKKRAQSRHSLPVAGPSGPEYDGDLVRRHTERAGAHGSRAQRLSRAEERYGFFRRIDRGDDERNWRYWDRSRTRGEPILATNPSATTDDSFDYNAPYESRLNWINNVRHNS